MAGHHPFAQLVAKIPPEAMARAAERHKNLGREVDLAILREALQLSQQKLAKKMRVNQPEVAKIEKRSDMLLSTLSKVLRAMGANLKIIASFPDHDIEIQSLGRLGIGSREGRRPKSKRAVRAHRRIARKTAVAG